MKLDIKHSEITGYNDSLIPLTLLTPDNGIDHMAIIFPGAGYTCEMPLLYYATETCLIKRMPVLHVGMNYARIPAWMETTNEERKKWCREDANLVWNYVNQELKHQSYSLIGKSAGTRCIAGLLENNVTDFKQILWLTPALQENWHLLRECGCRSFTVIGTDDRWWPLTKESLSEDHLVIEGADHSLEFSGDLKKSIDTLSKITTAIDDWLISE